MANKVSKDYNPTSEDLTMEPILMKDEGYAKLIFYNPTHFEKLMRKGELIIGRDPTLEEGSPETYVCVIGDDKISRKHAKIFWEFDKKEFFVLNVGKNNIWVDSKPLNSKDPPMAISNFSAIRIGKAEFYFCLPLQNY